MSYLSPVVPILYNPDLDRPSTVKEILQKEFGNDSLVGEVIDKYFTCYVDGLLHLDDKAKQLVGQVIERKRLGMGIAREWQKIILGADMIPHEGLVREALKAQYAFEKALVNLKLRDVCRFLCKRIESELKMWNETANGIKPAKKHFDILKVKADHFHKSFKEQRSLIDFQRRELLELLQDKMKNHPVNLGINGARDILKKSESLAPKEPEQNVPVQKSFFQKLFKWESSKGVQPVAESDLGRLASEVHSMIIDELKGEHKPSESACRDWAEKLDAALQDPVSGIQGAARQDRRVWQAVALHQRMYAGQKEYFQGLAEISALEKGACSKYDLKEDLSRIQNLTESFFVTQAVWSENLNAFLLALKEDKNKEICNEIGIKNLNGLGDFFYGLKQCVEEAPKEIGDLVKKKMKIEADFKGKWSQFTKDEDALKTKYAKCNNYGDQALGNFEFRFLEDEQNKAKEERTGDLEKMWSDWKKDKTPETIEAILGRCLDSVQASLKLAPHIFELNLFLNKKQEKIIGKIAKDQSLLSLYNLAIPQIYILPVKIRDCLATLVQGTELTPFMSKLAGTRASASKIVAECEFRRSLDFDVAGDNGVDRPVRK
jgi:hypothetical protein